MMPAAVTPPVGTVPSCCTADVPLRVRSAMTEANWGWRTLRAESVVFMK
jgi:hypothetical protein